MIRYSLKREGKGGTITMEMIKNVYSQIGKEGHRHDHFMSNFATKLKNILERLTRAHDLDYRGALPK